MMHARAYLAALTILLAAALGSLAAFNLVVDPYHAYRLVSPPALDRYKNTGMMSRTKSEDVRRGGWEAIFTGSSRVEVALDPQHPALHGMRTYNLGFSETSLDELAAGVRYALENNDLRLVVLLVDLELLGGRTGFGSELAQSPFNPSYSAVEYQASNLLGMRATEHSIATLEDYRADRPAYHDRLGRMSFPMKPPDASEFELFERSLRWRAEQPAFRYRPELAAVVEEMMDDCLENGVRLVVATPPMHALVLELLRRRGSWDAVERWKRDLVTAAADENARHPSAPPIELWDFAGFWSYNTEAVPPPAERRSEMRWHWEATHFRKELGDVVLARILAAEGADASFGVRLGAIDLERHLADQRAAGEQWRSTHPRDIEPLDRVEPNA